MNILKILVLKGFIRILISDIILYFFVFYYIGFYGFIVMALHAIAITINNIVFDKIIETHN